MAELPLRHSTPPEFIPFLLPRVRPNCPLAKLHPPPGSFLRQEDGITFCQGQRAGSYHPPRRMILCGPLLWRLGPVEGSHGLKGSRPLQKGYRIKTTEGMNSSTSILVCLCWRLGIRSGGSHSTQFDNRFDKIGKDPALQLINAQFYCNTSNQKTTELRSFREKRMQGFV